MYPNDPDGRAAKRARKLVAVAVGFCGGAVTLFGQTNASPSLAEAVREAAAGRTHIQETVNRLAALEDQTRSSNQVAQADCLRVRLVKLQGLLTIGNQAQEQLQAIPPDRTGQPWEQEALKIQFAVLRTDKLFAEALQCLDGVPAATPPNPVVARPAGKVRVRPRREPVTPRPSVVRNPATCISQGRLACLFVRAMELDPGTKDTATACQNELSRRAIEPLDGWQASQCATVDDLYVVAARVLNLRVVNPADPLSYGEALREAGLPVDALLPARVAGALPPVLVEDEVRSFLKHGYATPRMW